MATGPFSKLYDPDTEDTLEEDPHKAEANRITRDSVRNSCLADLRGLMSSSRAYTEKDFETYRDKGLSEESFELSGKTEHSEILEALEENRRLYIPQTIADVRAMEAKFYGDINMAAAQGWITSASASRWKERLASPEMLWWQKRSFLKNKFPKYMKNWMNLYYDLKEVEKKKKELNVSGKEVPELLALEKRGFKDANYDHRIDAVNRASAALTAYENRQTVVYKAAKQDLNIAVSKGILAEWKVGEILRKIFEAKRWGDPEKFVMGKQALCLRKFRIDWQTEKFRFDRIENRRKKEGTPPAFFFVTCEAFLDQNWKQRKTYLDMAEKSFEISVENPLILTLRHEMATKDWDSARSILKIAKQEILNEKQKEDLRSMEEYLNQHAEDPEETEELSQFEEVHNAMESMRAAIASIPRSLQRLYIDTINEGSHCMRSLGWILYNRIWCRQHGYLDEDKEARLAQTTSKETKQVIQDGHGMGSENNDLDYLKPAIREYRDGEYSPQILHLGSGGHNALLETMKTSNYSFNYWTTLIPEGVSYDEQKNLVDSINPTIKRSMRVLAKYNIPFTLTGKPVMHKAA